MSGRRRDDGGRRRISPLFTWRSAIIGSELPASARHVALTLSCFMSEVGDSAFPSLETLAAATGKGKSTISEALRELEEEDYLEVTRHKDGGAGRVNHYRARIPVEPGQGEPEPPFDGSRHSEQPVEEKSPETEPSSGTVLSPNDNGPEPDQKESRGRSLPRHDHARDHVRDRLRDPVWDGFVDFMRREPATRDERDVWNRAAKQIREALALELLQAFPEMKGDPRQLLELDPASRLYAAVRGQIRRRAGRYRREYPETKLTPRALSGHWGEFGDPVPAPPFEGETLDPSTTAEPEQTITPDAELEPDDLARRRIERARIYAERTGGGSRLNRTWDPLTCPDCGAEVSTYRQAAEHPRHEAAS